MIQIEAFPLKVTSIHYYRQKSTAHAIGRAQAEDGRYYIVKANSIAETNVCATEWVGASVATSLMLPVATVRVLQLEDGELVVGSQEIKPRLADIEVAQFLTGVPRNDLFVGNIVEITSSAYALDLALGNPDRHESNFVISVDSVDDHSQRRGALSLIDYGSSDVLNSERRPIPFPRGANTMRAGRLIRAAHGFSAASARETISRLRRDRNYIADRVTWGMPEEWLAESKRDELRRWMVGSSFVERLERIENGLEDGSYL